MPNPIIRKRHVFYLPGFDPRGVAVYQRLFKTESLKQSDVNHIQFTMGKREKPSDISSGWSISAVEDDTPVETYYEYLSWEDVVRTQWPQTTLALWWTTLSVILRYLLSGTILTVAKKTPVTLLTGLYPTFFVIASWMLCIASVWYAWVWFAGDLTDAGAILLGTVFATLIAWASRKLGDKINVFWLLRSYAFSARWAYQAIPALDKRIEAFAQRIESVLQNHELDEVLLIGHSTGTQLVVPLVSKLLDKGINDRRFHLLTLGDCIPMVSFFTAAKQYRQQLQQLGASTIYWVDVTSPIDGACFALLDPVRDSGLHLAEQQGPKVVSARFHTLFSVEQYQKMKKSWYRIHFQYIMATERSGDYDFFALVMGKRSLPDRLSRLKHYRKSSRV